MIRLLYVLIIERVVFLPQRFGIVPESIVNIWLCTSSFFTSVDWRISGCFGIVKFPSESYCGPSHHILRDESCFAGTGRGVRSAGFSSVGTYFHFSGWIICWTVATRLAFNVENLLAVELIRAKAIVESLQAYISVVNPFWFTVVWTVCIICAPRTIEHSSSLGMLSVFLGANMDLEHSKIDLVWDAPSDRAYIAAPYAFSEASQNKWSCIFSIAKLATKRGIRSSDRWCNPIIKALNWSVMVAPTSSSHPISCSQVIWKRILHWSVTGVRRPIGPLTPVTHIARYCSSGGYMYIFRMEQVAVNWIYQHFFVRWSKSWFFSIFILTSFLVRLRLRRPFVEHTFVGSGIFFIEKYRAWFNFWVVLFFATKFFIFCQNFVLKRDH